jgi:FMN-dependent NADH-azoreductase
MTTLLKIATSLSSAESSRLAERFTEIWLTRNTSGRVVTRDLAADPVPNLTAQRFQALNAKPAERTAAQRAVVEFSDALIEELKSADVIVIEVPISNYSLPSTLRAYIDHVARAGVTFRNTATGPEGLIQGKHTYVLTTRGGLPKDAADIQTLCLRQILGFIGLNDLRFIHAEDILPQDSEHAQESYSRSLHQSLCGYLHPRCAG